MKHIAIIGAGWAGLSAAAYLAPHYHVSLFEAGRVVGGRARTLTSSQFSYLDNGQHLLIGAYQEVFALLDRVGVSRETAFLCQPLQWYLAEGLQFQTPSYLPSPLNLLWGILNAKNALFKEKWALLRQMYALKCWYQTTLSDQSIATWLNSQNTSLFCREQFWQPLVWGAMNTPIDKASLRVLCHILTDSIWNHARYGDYYIPRIDLNQLFGNPVLRYIQKHGGQCHLQTRLDAPVFNGKKLYLNNKNFDAIILAVAPYHLSALLPPDLGKAMRDSISTLQYHAICTVYLRYDTPVRLPNVMVGLVHGTAQWLFDRSCINGANEIVATISLADQYPTYTQQDWVHHVQQDVLRLCPQAPAPIEWKVIHEKRATLACIVNRILPNQSDLNQLGIFVAGDWLHPHYPATLESAVQSGQQTAQKVMQFI